MPDTKPALMTLYTTHGPLRVSKEQYEKSNRTILTIYNRKGEPYCDWNSTGKYKDRICGVHRANLFPSKKEALANRDKIYFEMFGVNFSDIPQIP